MILSEVRDYVKQQRQVTLSDIALHFDVSPDAVRGMLDIWVRKGRMYRQGTKAACGTCNGCDLATVEIYIWGKAPSAKPCGLS